MRVFNNFTAHQKSVFENLSTGKMFYLILTGKELQIKAQKINFKIISFFATASREELRKRLSNRDMKDKLIVDERMKQFYSDIIHWVDYDYVLVNDDLKKCYKEVLKVIENTILLKKQTSFNKKKIEKHVKKLIS